MGRIPVGGQGRGGCGLPRALGLWQQPAGSSQRCPFCLHLAVKFGFLAYNARGFRYSQPHPMKNGEVDEQLASNASACGGMGSEKSGKLWGLAMKHVDSLRTECAPVSSENATVIGSVDPKVEWYPPL